MPNKRGRPIVVYPASVEERAEIAALAQCELRSLSRFLVMAANDYVRKRMCVFEDGKVAKAILNAILAGESTYEVRRKFDLFITKTIGAKDTGPSILVHTDSDRQRAEFEAMAMMERIPLSTFMRNCAKKRLEIGRSKFPNFTTIYEAKLKRRKITPGAGARGG